MKDLLSEQAGFEAGLNTLQTSVKKTTSAASAVDDLASKIKLLEDGILEQEKEIFLTSTNMIPPLLLV